MFRKKCISKLHCGNKKVQNWPFCVFLQILIFGDEQYMLMVAIITRQHGT